MGLTNQDRQLKEEITKHPPFSPLSQVYWKYLLCYTSRVSFTVLYKPSILEAFTVLYKLSILEAFTVLYKPSVLEAFTVLYKPSILEAFTVLYSVGNSYCNSHLNVQSEFFKRVIIISVTATAHKNGRLEYERVTPIEAHCQSEIIEPY